MAMRRQIWIPKDFQHIREWLSDEVARRGQQNELGSGALWQAIDDLGNYLAEDESENIGVAIFCAESGREPKPVPLHEWRSRESRIEITRERVYRNLNAWTSYGSEWVCVAVRRTFRLPDAGQSEVKAATQLAPAEVERFLKELNAEYEGKTAPRHGEIDRLGRTRYGARWRKKFADERNLLDASDGKVYPNLYSNKSGPRSAS
jgi:hypothetical protein